MKFSVEAFDLEIPTLADRLLELTGLRPWTRRFAWLDREFVENNYMHDWLRQHCAVELAMKDALAKRQLSVRRPFVVETIAQHQLASFIVGVGT
jgi:hypothetical protein